MVFHVKVLGSCDGVRLLTSMTSTAGYGHWQGSFPQKLELIQIDWGQPHCVECVPEYQAYDTLFQDRA